MNGTLGIHYSNLDNLTNKKTEISQLIDEDSPDVMCFTEICNKGDIFLSKNDIELKGYDNFSNVDKAKRGAIIYVKKGLMAREYKGMETYNFEECTWCQLENGNKEKILVGNVYRSPNSSRENTQKLYDMLGDNKLDDFDHVIITGDFNFPNTRWDGSNCTDDIQEAVRDGFLTQHVDQPTHFRGDNRRNILDLVLTKNEDTIANIEYCSPIGKSHHLLLKIRTNIVKIEGKEEIEFKFCPHKGDYQKFRKRLKEEDWSKLEATRFQGCYRHFASVIKEGMQDYIPRVESKEKKNKPRWLSHKISKSVKKKYKLFKKYLNSQNGKTYQKYVEERNKVNKEIKKAKYNYEKDIAKKCKENPKQFWSHVNSKRKCKENIKPLLKTDGTYATSNKDKAEVLSSQFSSVFTKEDLINMPKVEPGEWSEGCFLADIVITEEAVKNKLKALNPNKARGPDSFYPRVLKELAEEIAQPITMLFNKSLEEGIVPEEWTQAEVCAIFKDGNKNDPSNYRPISLTSVLCKILESFVTGAIQSYMESLGLYSECQHGFRKGKSCITQLLEVIEDFHKLRQEGEPFDIIYLDFKKAFDSVPHQRLLTKLRGYGIEGKVLQWIKAFLLNRTQRIKVGNETSASSKVTSGIPQGSILGPVLFTIFINDLPESVDSIVKVFADDTKLYNKSKNHRTIQKDLDTIQNWSSIWQLGFNIKKCKCLHVGQQNERHEYILKTATGPIEIVEVTEEKDLGVWFDEELKFERHITEKINKANQSVGIIKKNFEFMDMEIFLLLYKAIVRPHLEYGQSIWHPNLKKQVKAVEKVQRRATKLVKEIAELTYEERLEWLGLPSMKYRRLRGDMITVFNIFQRGDQNTFFKFNLDIGTRGHSLKIFKSHSNREKFIFF